MPAIAPSVDVQWYLSGQTGNSTIITYQTTQLYSALKRCFVTGYNTVTLSSLVVSNEIATATVSAGHGFSDWVVVSVGGATPAGLNGLFRITWVSSTVFTFVVPSAVDGSATGTITCKVAPPANWDLIADNGSTKLVIRQSNILMNRLYWEFNITNNGGRCRITGYVNYDAGTFTGTVPTQTATGGTYAYNGTGHSSAGSLLVVASRFGFWLSGNKMASDEYPGAAFHGQYVKSPAVDPYPGLAMGWAATNTMAITGPGALGTADAAHSGQRAFGSVSEATVALSCYTFAAFGPWLSNSGSVYPSPNLGNTFLVVPCLLLEAANNKAVRGFVPGMYGQLSQRTLTLWEIIPNILIDGTMRKMMLIGNKMNSGSTAYFLVDITGPWG